MDNFQIETAQNVSINQNTAGIGERILAFLVDIGILIIYEVSVVLIINALDLDAMDSWVRQLIMGLPLFLYFLLWETFWNGRTPGKALLRIRVVKMDGSIPSFSVYLIRWLMRVVDISLSLGGIAVVTILFNGRGQRLGDIAAGSTVISEKRRVGLQNTLTVNVPEGYVPKYPQVTVFNDEEIQTIKNMFREFKMRRNYQIIIQLSKKVADVMEVTPEEKPADFINTVLTDYNFYTQQS